MLISVMLGGETKFNEAGQPYNEGGSLGYMDTDELTLKTNTWDNDNEAGKVIEYWEGAELRHRSVDLHLKTPLDFGIFQGKF